MDPVGYTGQERRLRFLHPLDIQLYIPPGPEIQFPLHESVYFMFHHHIVDNSPVIHNGVQFRFHLIRAVAAKERFLDPMFLEFMELISPWRGNDRCPTGPEQGNIPYDDLAAHLTGFGHLRTGYRFVGLFEHGQDSIPPFFVFHGSSPPCS